MDETATFRSHKALILNFLAFTICFAAWMLNGVLVAYLADNQVFTWGPVEIGWLMGIPVLTGSVFRLPAGLLTDRFGGKWVHGLLLVFCALPMFWLSKATSFMDFAIASFGFGLAGTSFSIGIANTSVWYPKRWQGTALGIFGAGNAGAALTTLFAPTLLKSLTDNGTDVEGWRKLPVIYSLGLLGMGLLYLALSTNKKPDRADKSFREMLSPLGSSRVWRFGLYYFLVFGCFVALSQWLVPYFLSVYSLDLVTAGLFVSAFSLPSGLIRALGGWMSDAWGARKVMYWILGLSIFCCGLLVVPRMEIYSPGSGVMARRAGTVEEVSGSLVRVGGVEYPLRARAEEKTRGAEEGMLVFPTKSVWQEPVVQVGEQVKKKQLLAKGLTRIYFQANVWIAAFLIFVVGIVWGIGKAAVYKHIPEYFPGQVGVVGGMVGVLGGLGGFFGPVIFGYLLELTGLWTSMWMFLCALSVLCLLWMHKVVRDQTTIAPGTGTSSTAPRVAAAVPVRRGA